jgi:dihydroorotase
MDVVVEGNCYISGKLERCCIGIEHGRIARIAKILEGDKILNFGSRLVIPAATDAHVHFREPGMTHKEDFGSGSLSAVCGGVTCVLDMPNTKPPTTTVQALREKKRIASSKSLVDFGIYAGVFPGMSVDQLAKEAIGFKLYMAGTTGDLMVPSLTSIRGELSTIAASGKVLAVHAEDESLRTREVERSLEDHLRNRGNDCETSAIKKIKAAAKDCQLHICHVSARESIPLIENVERLTSEVSPHHLFLDKSSNLGSQGKVNPPLRKREDRQALFQALKGGSFDIIASDHAPHTIDEKQEDFDYAPTGMPGVETLAPLVLQLVKDRHIGLGDAVRRLSERPAQIFGINKGKLDVGFDADMMVVDLMDSTTIRADMLHSRCGWTAYEGKEGVFPKAVFLRGEVMVEGGNQVGERMGRDVVEGAKTA